MSHLLHPYIQAVLGSPVHLRDIWMTGNVVLIENAQLESPTTQNKYVLSVHYVLGIMCNIATPKLKINKAKFFFLSCVDYNISIAKVEACLLGLTPPYIGLEDGECMNFIF